MIDLRSFLAKQRDESADFVEDRERLWEPRLEVSAYLNHLEGEGRFPLTLLHRVKDLEGQPSAYPLVSNLFATRQRIAAAVGLAPSEAGMPLALELQRRQACPLQPVVIPRSEAPVKEVFGEVDLFRLPALTHHLDDSGPYLTTTAVARDPDSGVHNVSFHRAMIQDRQRITLYMERRHMWDYYRRYAARGRPMPIAYVLGHHPAFFLGACALVPIQVDEYDVIGGLLGQPLRLVASELYGDELLVPADAEMILEGEVSLTEELPEAPFGDFTGTYSPAGAAPVVCLKRMTARRDAMFLDIFVGHADHRLLGSVPKEAGIFDRVRAIVPTVSAVNLPQSGTGRFVCYVSIAKKTEGEARLAGMAALTTSELIKHVIVVDEDVDVFDDQDVLWAMATRVQADRDVQIIPGTKGSLLDDSAGDPNYACKMIVDATKRLDKRPLARLECAAWPLPVPSQLTDAGPGK